MNKCHCSSINWKNIEHLTGRLRAPKNLRWKSWPWQLSQKRSLPEMVLSQIIQPIRPCQYWNPWYPMVLGIPNYFKTPLHLHLLTGHVSVFFYWFHRSFLILGMCKREELLWGQWNVRYHRSGMRMYVCMYVCIYIYIYPTLSLSLFIVMSHLL